ncbi:MAG: CinA family protein [Clostridiales bacterium]|nr:CinA family protein [Clostridiales bacterium]
MTMNDSTQTERIRERVVLRLIEINLSITTMESCTSGLLASAITDTEGASAIFKGAFVTYSNEAKVQQGVEEGLIERCGVYSLPVAEAMARACRKAYGAEVGVGVTGTMGNPDPANADSVLGEVFYAIVWGEKKCLRRLQLEMVGQTRHAMKEKVVDEVMRSLAELLGI